VYYVPTGNNVEADTLSRLWNPKHDWQLLPVCFRKFLEFTTAQGLPRPVVDRFASFANRLLPRYNSLYHDRDSEGNFWSSDPAQEVSWINPPWNRFQEVIDFLQQSSCEAWILAPHWPDKPWFSFFYQKSLRQYHLPRNTVIFTPETAQGKVTPPKYSCTIFLLRFPC
jgi:hypothetical protein